MALENEKDKKLLSYKPKTGKNAGINNRKKIVDYLKENPGCTGVEIAKELGLSTNAVYRHLKEIQECC